MQLTTDRLLLRTPVIEDSKVIQKYFNDWSIIQFMRPPVPWPYPENGAYQYLSEVLLPDIEAQKSISFAICLKETEELIGLLTFKSEDGGKTYEFGFWIARHQRGKGFMTQAAREAIKYFFKQKGDVEIYARNALENASSHRIQEKCGFVLEGIFETSVPYYSGDKQEERWSLVKEKND